MATGIRQAGEFCWINILTADPEQACRFFERVLGWTYFEMPGMGYGMQVGGRNIGGLFDLEGPNTPPGCVPVVGVMVKVESADAACEKVTALGGAARPAFDILDSGRMAVCSDPTGAGFDIWEPKKMPGTDADSSLHGAPSWFEARTADSGRARDVFSALFGWTPPGMSMPGHDYTVFKKGGTDVAGLMQITPEMAGMQPHWATFFTVDDADVAAQESVSLGATLDVPPKDIPGVGRFAAITSPQGVMFLVLQHAR